MDLSLQQLQRAVSLRKRIAQLEKQLAKLFGGTATAPTKKRGKGRRKMSAAGKAKIAAAQRARWARVKGKSAEPKAKRRRSGLTAAGRRKLSQNMKARWAARRKGKT